MSDSIVKIGFDIATADIDKANRGVEALLKKVESLDNKKIGANTKKSLDETARAAEKASREIQILAKQKENLEKGFSKSASLAIAKMQVAGVPASTIASYSSLRKETDALASSMNRVRVSSSGAFSVLSGFGLTLGGAIFAQGAVVIGGLADQMTLLEARIKLVTPATENLANVQKQLLNISLENRTGLTETITLYNRLQPALSRYGKTTSEVLDITNAFGKTLLLSGANSREASAAILQFSQAMGSGKLAGDEFRSVAEAAPALLDALAKGGNVARDSLKSMSQDGLLTTKFVAEALQNTLLDLTRATVNIPVTVGQAFQNTKTGFAFFVNELNKTYGVTQTFSDLLQQVTKVFIGLGDALASGQVKEFTNNLGIAVGVAGGLGTTLYILSVANNAANFSLINYAKNLRIVTGLQTAFNLVVAANPYVLAVAAITGIVTALFSMRKSLVEVSGVSVTIGNLIASTFDAIKERVGSAIKFVSDSYKKVYSTLSDVFSSLFSFLSDTIAGRLLKKLVDAFTNTIKALVGVGARFAKAFGLDELSKSFNAYISDLGQDIVIGAVVRDSKLGKPDAVNPFANDGSGKPSPDPKAQKELDDKLKQMREFSAQYATQIADLQRINALVAEGKSIEDARYKVELDRQLIDARKSGATEKQIIQMSQALAIEKQNLAVAKEREEAEKAIQKQKEFNLKAEEDFYKKEADFLKPEKLEIGDLFGDASKSAGALINVFDTINKQQEEYNELLADAVVYNKDVTNIEKQRSKNELRNIGSILGATKGFFKEKSTGYKLLSAAEKAFRAFELAQAAKNFAVNMGFINAETGAYIAGSVTKKATEAGFTAFTVVQKGIQAAASGVAALASSMAGLPFPLNLAAFAATGALLASIGIGLGGGRKSGRVAPTNEGTGTVFGDKDAKSESIKRSIDLLAENSKIELPITSAMLRSLQNIEANIGGLTNLVIRSGGVGEKLAESVNTGFQMNTTGKALRGAVAIATLGASELLGIGKLLGGLFGTKIKVKGQGFFGADQKLGDIFSEGFNLQEFVDIQKKKKSFGITTKTSNSTRFGEADASIERQFSLIFAGFYDSIKLAALPLGENLDLVTNRLDNFVVSIGKINLKGLKGEEIQEKLEAVFGAAADSIAQAAIPGLEDFQKVGEGYFETVVRVSSGIEQAAQALSLFGVTAVNFKDIVLKQGDVGVEIIRQSLVLANGISGVSDILQQASVDSVDSIVELANTLYSLRDNVIAIGGNFADITVALVKGAGGVDRLSNGLDTFFEEFLTAEEQASELARRTARDFAKLGIAVPVSKDAFKTLVRGIDTTTEAGQQLLGSVLALAPAFSEMSSAAEDAGNSLNEAARSLYETIRDARVESLVPTQQLDVLLSEYQSAVNLATQSTGQNLADNASVVNDLIQPLLDSISSVYASGPEAQRLIDSVLGQAKNVADKAAAESFTFQDESLRLLQAQVNELEAIRSALSVGVFTPVNLTNTGNVVPFVAPPSSSVNVNVQNSTDNSGIILALTESNAHAAALVRLQQAANEQIIRKLTQVEERLDGLESAASLAASA